MLDGVAEMQQKVRRPCFNVVQKPLEPIYQVLVVGNECYARMGTRAREREVWNLEPLCRTAYLCSMLKLASTRRSTVRWGR